MNEGQAPKKRQWNELTPDEKTEAKAKLKEALRFRPTDIVGIALLVVGAILVVVFLRML